MSVVLSHFNILDTCQRNCCSLTVHYSTSVCLRSMLSWRCFVSGCEECLTLFQEQSDPDDINSPSFVLDFPTSLDVPQRALLTLPFGLMIGRSSIPSAGVGVINHGPVVSPGMHFGPYEGEMTTRENALASDFSWEVNYNMSN